MFIVQASTEGVVIRTALHRGRRFITNWRELVSASDCEALNTYLREKVAAGHREGQAPTMRSAAAAEYFATTAEVDIEVVEPSQVEAAQAETAAAAQVEAEIEVAVGARACEAQPPAEPSAAAAAEVDIEMATPSRVEEAQAATAAAAQVEAEIEVAVGASACEAQPPAEPSAAAAAEVDIEMATPSRVEEAHAATAIAARVRSSLIANAYRNEMRRRRAAASIVQAGYRGHSAWLDETRTLRIKSAAVVLLQCQIRGLRHRKQMNATVGGTSGASATTSALQISQTTSAPEPTDRISRPANESMGSEGAALVRSHAEVARQERPMFSLHVGHFFRADVFFARGPCAALRLGLFKVKDEPSVKPPPLAAQPMLSADSGASAEATATPGWVARAYGEGTNAEAVIEHAAPLTSRPSSTSSDGASRSDAIEAVARAYGEGTNAEAVIEHAAPLTSRPSSTSSDGASRSDAIEAVAPVPTRPIPSHPELEAPATEAAWRGQQTPAWKPGETSMAPLSAMLLPSLPPLHSGPPKARASCRTVEERKGPRAHSNVPTIDTSIAVHMSPSLLSRAMPWEAYRLTARNAHTTDDWLPPSGVRPPAVSRQLPPIQLSHAHSGRLYRPVFPPAEQKALSARLKSDGESAPCKPLWKPHVPVPPSGRPRDGPPARRHLAGPRPAWHTPRSGGRTLSAAHPIRELPPRLASMRVAELLAMEVRSFYPFNPEPPALLPPCTSRRERYDAATSIR